jgi:hypothetical protein
LALWTQALWTVDVLDLTSRMFVYETQEWFGLYCNMVWVWGSRLWLPRTVLALWTQALWTVDVLDLTSHMFIFEALGWFGLCCNMVWVWGSELGLPLPSHGFGSFSQFSYIL